MICILICYDSLHFYPNPSLVYLDSGIRRNDEIEDN